LCVLPAVVAFLTGADLRLTIGLPVLGFVAFVAAPMGRRDVLGRAHLPLITNLAILFMWGTVAAALLIALWPLWGAS
jgi:hypothetical protein